jgi:hypothetical protein
MAYCKAHTTHGDRSLRGFSRQVLLRNTLKLTQPTVIGILQGFYFKSLYSYRLMEYIKAHSTHRERPFIGILSQVKPRYKPQLIQAIVIGRLELSYFKFLYGFSVMEYSKANTTHGDRILQGFISSSPTVVDSLKTVKVSQPTLIFISEGYSKVSK